jgi:hypothetical protein
MISRLTTLRISRGRHARRSEFCVPLSASGYRAEAELPIVRARQLHARLRQPRGTVHYLESGSHGTPLGFPAPRDRFARYTEGLIRMVEVNVCPSLASPANGGGRVAA